MSNKVVYIHDPKQLGRIIEDDQDRLMAEVKAAIYDAATISTRLIRSRVPVDTGELRRSVHVEPTPSGGATVVYDAPYAAFQEAGTRPFTPPFDAILAWVMRQAPNMGLGDELKTYKKAGRAVKRANKSIEKARTAATKARAEARLSAATDKQSAAAGPLVAKARAVWNAIRTRGIKAKWFERDSLDDRRRVLARMISRAVRGHQPTGAR